MYITKTLKQWGVQRNEKSNMVPYDEHVDEKTMTNLIYYQRFQHYNKKNMRGNK